MPLAGFLADVLSIFAVVRCDTLNSQAELCVRRLVQPFDRAFCARVCASRWQFSFLASPASLEYLPTNLQIVNFAGRISCSTPQNGLAFPS